MVKVKTQYQISPAGDDACEIYNCRKPHNMETVTKQRGCKQEGFPVTLNFLSIVAIAGHILILLCHVVRCSYVPSCTKAGENCTAWMMVLYK